MLSVQCRVRRHRGAVEDRDVARESRDHQLDVEADEFLRGDCRTGLHQDLEPHTKAIDVELVITAGPSAPEIDVEHTRELLGRGERHEFGAFLEPADLYDAVKNVG